MNGATMGYPPQYGPQYGPQYVPQYVPPPMPPPRRRDNTGRNQLRILAVVVPLMVVSVAFYGIDSLLGDPLHMKPAATNSPAAAPPQQRTGPAHQPSPTSADTASDQGGGVRSGVRNFLPRLHKVSGIGALSAECRDMWYFPHGSTVDVTVNFQGPGLLDVEVLPAPGDGTNQQSQRYTIGLQASAHTFVFHDVPGKVDHVLVTVTAEAGVDQCYARKG
jgi:hypothetical protein